MARRRHHSRRRFHPVRALFALVAALVVGLLVAGAAAGSVSPGVVGALFVLAVAMVILSS